MKLDISAKQFEALSNEAKKKHIVQLLISDAGASPVPIGTTPIAFVMAGIPGAGKTEYLDSITEKLAANNYDKFVRIDLDQIVTIYPDYTPKTYSKFRGQGTTVLARCVDELKKGNYNMMIDGTFSGKSGSSLSNVKKLIEKGYIVLVMYMYDKPETAWRYTQLREMETERGIDIQGFIESCENITNNLKEAILMFRGDSQFRLTVIKQQELRSKTYDYLTEDEDIDKLLSTGYNIDKLKELL